MVSVSRWQTEREREKDRIDPNTPHIDTSIINVVDGILYQEDEAEDVEVVVVEEEDKEKKEKEKKNRCNFEKSSSCCCRIK